MNIYAYISVPPVPASPPVPHVIKRRRLTESSLSERRRSSGTASEPHRTLPASSGKPPSPDESAARTAQRETEKKKHKHKHKHRREFSWIFN